jgi:iron complex outermembrane receptor protein
VKRSKIGSSLKNPERARAPGVEHSTSTIGRAVRKTLRGCATAAGVAPVMAALFTVSGGANAQNAAPPEGNAPAQKSDATSHGRHSRQQNVLSEVVVTARRKANEKADIMVKNSESLINVVLADDAGKLPDNSITEVLQRVPGVTITRWGDPDHFQAQGVGIQVRGLSDVAGRINGQEVFSANGANGLNWSDIPPELMKGVVVYKEATADLIEGGTGGQVDLLTKMPFDYKGLAFQASGSGNYADFRKKTSPTGSMLLSDRFDVGRLGQIGFLADIAYGKYASRADFMAIEPFYKTLVAGQDRYIPGGFDYGVGTYDQTRKGAYAAFQWRLNPYFELSQTYFESKYSQANIGQGVFMDSQTMSVNPNGNNYFDSAGGLLKSNSMFIYSPTALGVPSGTLSAGGDTGVGAYSSDTRDLNTAFNFNAPSGNWFLKGAFQAVDSTMNSLSYDVFPNIPFSTGNFSMDATGIAVVSEPNSNLAALRDPSQYSYEATMDHLAGNTAHMNAYNLDYTHLLSDTGFFRSFQMGARYANHTESDETSGYDWQALGVGWNGYPPVSFAQGRPQDYSSVVFSNFFRGMVPAPANVLLPSIAMAQAADLLGDHQRYGNPLTHGIQYVPEDLADVQYANTALYGLVRFASDKGIFGIPYRGNFGVRVVRTKHTAQGWYHQQAGSYVDPATNTTYTLTDYGIPMAGGKTNTFALPSLTVELMPNSNWQTRLFYSETMDVPQVTDIQANGTFGATTVNIAANSSQPAINALSGWSVNFGNPNLRPVLSHNYDFEEAWYPKPGTVAHIDAFYKSIDNWLEYSSISMPWNVVYTTGAQQVTVNYNGYSNSSQTATVEGAEIGVHTYFDMLPGALKGLGIDTNYTFINSSNPGDIYYDINGNPHHNVPIEGLSRENFNLALLYDYRIWSARLAYSWRSKYLLSTNTNGTNGSYNYYSANTAPGTNCQSPAVTTCKYVKIALPVWSGAYGELDFSLTVNPSKHFYMSFQVANLTNRVIDSFQAGYPGGEYPRNWFISDRHFVLSAGLKFGG